MRENGQASKVLVIGVHKALDTAAVVSTGTLRERRLRLKQHAVYRFREMPDRGDSQRVFPQPAKLIME